MECCTRLYRVAAKDMVYLKFILEGYEGMCTMSTIDPKEGIVRVVSPLPFAGDVAALIQALSNDIAVSEVAAGGC